MKAIAAIVLCGMGLVGAYFKVDHTGWVIFAGVVVAAMYAEQS